MMNIHPAADSFPMMDKQAFADLVESIAARGQQEPIVKYNGTVLDGRNRLKACLQLGIQPKFIEYSGSQSPWLWAWDRNAERRSIDKGTKAAIWLNIEDGDQCWRAEVAKIKEEADKKRSAAAKEQHKASKPRAGEKVYGSSYSVTTTKHKENKTRNARAKKAGTSPATMAKAEVLKKNAPSLHSKVAAGKKTLASAYKEYQRGKKAKALAKAIAQVDDLIKRVNVMDFRECVASCNADVVITDPPYPQEFVECYGQLAKACAGAGIKTLAAMAGQSYLPQILSEMAEHMPYRWTLAYLTPGGQAVQLWDRKVNTFWKPVIVMGEPGEDWLGDVARSATNNNDKSHHHWGQSESGMIDLVERLSKPGQIVCDPFCGAGTTGVASLACGRGFVGADIDAGHVAKTKERIGL